MFLNANNFENHENGKEKKSRDITAFEEAVSLYNKRFGQLRRFLKNLRINPDKPQHANVCEYTNFDSSNDSVNYLIDEKFNDNYQLINKIRFAHMELVKVAKITDSVYGLSMTITLMITSATCTGILYIIWVTVCIKNQGTMMEKLEQIEILLGWLFFSILKFVIISFACGRTSNSASNIGNIICQLHEPSASKKFCSELTNFVFQLMDTKLVFKPCGLIELNNSTLCYIVSSILSLLIVLIQIRDIPSSSEELLKFNNTKTIIAN
ncbi:hypothetical protein HCN44_005503 [Aphidius gifuensis]|uniref:Gustatory receptor n=1 Tax=Aphidius gifuensis TaxID=684658 RepID=A0A834Y233_APHGI|nr:hypothetical protein HCN44_005503 [Aphidius gifuensis]